MHEKLIAEVFKVFVKYGYINERHLRDEKIMNEYKELRESGITGKAARGQLAEKYFISLKSIEHILYRKK